MLHYVYIQINNMPHDKSVESLRFNNDFEKVSSDHDIGFM